MNLHVSGVSINSMAIHQEPNEQENDSPKELVMIGSRICGGLVRSKYPLPRDNRRSVRISGRCSLWMDALCRCLLVFQIRLEPSKCLGTTACYIANILQFRR